MYKISLTYEGRKIHIEMEHRVSILSDDSGIGKTFVAKAVKNSLNVKQYSDIQATINDKECSVDVIFDECEKEKAISTITNAQDIVIIDEADKLFALYPIVLDVLQKNDKAVFLLILRGEPDDYITSPLQYLTFTTNGKEITIKPYKSNVNNFYKVG